MKIKKRFSIIFSCLFSVLLATVMFTVYFLFAEFRKNEFKDRLAEKAESTFKLLVVVKEIDYNMQKIIDRNSINRMYNENTEVFNENKRMIYDSNDSVRIKWLYSDFEQISKKHRFSRKSGGYDVVGLYFTYQNHFYYVLISAEDKFGNSKLNYLKYLLLGAFVVGTSLVWSLAFRLSKKSLKPLDIFRRQIQEITDNDLTVRVSTVKREDEINELAKSFNQMMDRIDKAYNRQKEFTGNASHELRTPVARIAAQLENLSHHTGLNPELKKNVKSISEDTFQLSEIINSLVVLASIDYRDRSFSFKKIRLDEMVFSAASGLSAIYPDLKLKFEIENMTGQDIDLEIPGDVTLLKMVLENLLKNAYIYSDNQCVDCIIRQKSNCMELIITNTGEVPQVDDAAVLFTTFYRGSNTKHTPGSGIGLSIVHRILQYHQAEIDYRIVGNNTNQVTITFRHTGNP